MSAAPATTVAEKYMVGEQRKNNLGNLATRVWDQTTHKGIRFYCGKARDGDCPTNTCYGQCGPLDGCNCSACEMLDRTYPSIQAVNHKGRLATKKFGTKGKYAVQIRYYCGQVCPEISGTNCGSCKLLDASLGLQHNIKDFPTVRTNSEGRQAKLVRITQQGHEGFELGQFRYYCGVDHKKHCEYGTCESACGPISGCSCAPCAEISKNPVITPSVFDELISSVRNSVSDISLEVGGLKIETSSSRTSRKSLGSASANSEKDDVKTSPSPLIRSKSNPTETTQETAPTSPNVAKKAAWASTPTRSSSRVGGFLSTEKPKSSLPEQLPVTEPSSIVKEPVKQWKCRDHRLQAHDFFISYRKKTDAVLAKNLSMALPKYIKDRSSKEATVFLDDDCLVDCEDWEIGFLMGLSTAKIVVLLISEAGLESAKRNSVEQQDNVLLEWEYALIRMKTESVKVFPVFIRSMKEPGVYKDYRPNPEDFPNLPHRRKKPLPGADLTVQGLMEKINSLNGPRCHPKPDGLFDLNVLDRLTKAFLE